MKSKPYLSLRPVAPHLIFVWRAALGVLVVVLLGLSGCQAPETSDTGGAPVVPALEPGPSPQEPEAATAVADWTVPERYRGEILRQRVRYFPHQLLALTFDDGPDPQITPKVLKALSEYDARATFFVLGQCAEQHPELLHDIVAAGHALGNHSYSHPARPSAEQAIAELEKTEQIIQQTTGRKTSLFRPPYGITDNALTRRALARGYTVVLWTISSADSNPIGPEVIASNVIYTPNPGDIVLMHDGSGHHRTAEALPRILEELGEAGFEFVTLPALMRAWEEGENQSR